MSVLRKFDVSLLVLFPHFLIAAIVVVIIASSSLLAIATATIAHRPQYYYYHHYTSCIAFQDSMLMARRSTCVRSSRQSSFLNACRLSTPSPPLSSQEQSTAAPKSSDGSNLRYWYSSPSSITMMPEGPEVRSLVDQLQGGIGRRLVNIQFLSGRYVNNNNGIKPDGWHEFVTTMTPLLVKDDRKTLTASTIEAVDIITDWACKGKFMYILLDKGKRSSSSLNPADNDGEMRISTRSSSNTVKNHRNNNVDDPDYQRSIWITLGMTGRFLSQSDHEQCSASQQQHARWCLHLAQVVVKNNTNATTTAAAAAHNSNPSTTTTTTFTKIFYHDPRSFGTLKFCTSRLALFEKLQSLGPDIFTTTQQDFVQIMSSTNPQSMNICKFLMNQNKISGIGNYILAEGLYRARMDPFASLDEFQDEQQQRRLFQELQAVVVESYQCKNRKIEQQQSQQTTSSNKRRRLRGQEEEDDSENKSKVFEFQCYGREFGLACGQPVIKEINGPHGRTIWYTEQQLFMPRSERRAKLLLRSSLEQQQSQVGGLGATTKRRQIIKNDNAQVNDKFMARNESDDDGDDGDDDGHDTSSEAAVTNLVQHLHEDSWKEALHDVLHSDSFQQLAMFLQQEHRQGAIVYPPDQDIFSALNLCPLPDVKVVIVGQDPYHGPGQGHGLAFSVRRGVKIPPSLQNIFREIDNDVALQAVAAPSLPQHGNLEDWAKQGVLLLNTVLTVRSGEANSHANKGWEEFTDAVIRSVSNRKPLTDQDGVVFLLWGNPAHKKAKGVVDDDETNRHVVIRTSHPSPLGATKTNTPFLGSRCFSRANEALQRMGKTPIDWNVAP